MVKGVSRHVIVVASPDKRYFDEVIFILRGDLPASERSSSAVEQAQHIAARCAARYGSRPSSSSPPSALLWTLLGAAIMGVLWVLTTL